MTVLILCGLVSSTALDILVVRALCLPLGSEREIASRADEASIGAAEALG